MCGYIFGKIVIVSFLSVRYKSDGLYCRVAGTPSSPTLFFIRVYFIPTLIKSIVGDDRVPAILQYRPSNLYLTDRKETMGILQKYTHTPLHVHKYSLPSFILFSHKINYSYKCILMFHATHGHLASCCKNPMCVSA